MYSIKEEWEVIRMLEADLEKEPESQWKKNIQKRLDNQKELATEIQKLIDRKGEGSEINSKTGLLCMGLQSIFLVLNDYDKIPECKEFVMSE